VAVKPGENFYGFGEKFSSLNKWNQEIISWGVDAGNVTSQRSYKNIPFFMSSAGYGIFIHSSYPIIYRMGSESSISYSFHVAEPELDYFLIHGPDFKHILKRYSFLTGQSPLPPKWSFGFWISRCGYKNRLEVETVIEEMRTRDYPCDVISLDPWWMGEQPWSTYEWDRVSFPGPEEMIANLRAKGVRTCLWIHPYIPVGTSLFQEGRARNFFVQKPGSKDFAPVVEAFSGTNLAAVDFTNADARKWFQSKLQKLLDQGVAVFKTDFGEQAPVEAVYCDGRSGLEMHNLYPLLYNRTVFELTERFFKRGLTWGRSGYAGSQRYPIQWGGDSYSSLDHLAGQVRGLLSYGLSGVPFCSHDVGGFDYSPEAFAHDVQVDFPKDDVVYVRWLQCAVFSSHLRAHGKQPREPWTYGPEVEQIARRYLKLRYRLLPYIYSEAVRSTETSLPMVRPLVLEYPADANTWSLDTQYLFGDCFLVAPVLNYTGNQKVYLPAGNWVDYWRKNLLPGGQWLDIKAPLEELPLWVKAGAIIPLGPEMSFVEEKPCDPLTLEIYYPQGEHDIMISDEDKTPVRVKYQQQPGELRVDIESAPRTVELRLYGTQIKEAIHNKQIIPHVETSTGYVVRFESNAAYRIIIKTSD
jgi:alpha-D-xyloside xylohydrolase